MVYYYHVFGVFLSLYTGFTQRNVKLFICFKYLNRGKKIPGHAMIGSFRGLIQNFQRASPPFHMQSHPPLGGWGVTVIAQ